MPAFAKIDVVVDGQSFAQSLNRFAHRSQSTVTVLAGKDRIRRRIIAAKDILPGFALDAVAADYGSVRSLCAILELQVNLAVLLLRVDYTLAEVSDFGWDQLDHLVQKFGPVGGCLTGRTLDLVQLLASSFLGRGILPVADIKPDIAIRLPLIGCCAVVECCLDGRIDELHRSSGVGSEGNACADLTEVVGGLHMALLLQRTACMISPVAHLAYSDRHILLEKPNGERKACNASPNNGDVEGLWVV